MSQPFVGEIRMTGFNFAPVNWFLCQGQLLAISQYSVLFTLIGTTYGGDGVTTFALPDLRGRVPVHQGDGAGLSNYILGQAGGSEAVTLLTSEIPKHTHLLNAQSGTGSQPSPSGGVWASSLLDQFSTATPTATMAPEQVENTGGSQPHDNMSPYLCINFIISAFGIFPSQN
jgi:microcystin-dependent protein